ncbi:hypothetical protein FQR65_LT12139 [Abscondita terminalis]|nr:hypothetical protein FQR65_LT12139 [Abscondita terminalis]
MRFVLVLYYTMAFVHSTKLLSHDHSVWSNLTNEYVEECVLISKVSPSLVDEILIHADVPDDKNLHCYLKCIYEKIHFLLPNGEFDEDEIVEKAHYANPEITEKCIEVADFEKELCRKSFLFGRCVLHELAELKIQKT